MRIKKEDLAKKLEGFSENLSGRLPEAVKDISNSILFLSLYCGNNLAKEDEVKLKFKNNSFYVTKSSKYDELAQKFEIYSYNETQRLEIIISKSYFRIEKKTDNDFSYYCVEYFFKEGNNYSRVAEYKNMPIDKEVMLEERSEGVLGVGIYYSEIVENNDGITMLFTKIPDKSKVENIYYSYFTSPSYKLFYKVPKEYKSIPCVNAQGLNEISNFLNKQNEFIRFEDESLFNSLVDATIRFYKKNNRQ